jgi:2,4-dienoyl-CoA reductase-like NADH-dependent reductase (Old Yellow Enzyme family)
MPGLFDPIQIKGLTLKNRLVMPPMANGFGAEDGAAGDKHIAHYTARAKGGVGLIIIEHTFVSKEGKASKGQLGLDDDKLIPGLKKLVDAIHADGAKVIIQLNHVGAAASRLSTGMQPVGPSEIMHPKGSELPHALTAPEMKILAVKFGEAARRAAAHGFLLCQFLSPYTNRRTDEYGGSLENRLRFPTEVIREVKSKLGKNVPLFYRFGADDMREGGLTREEGKKAAHKLEQAGVDVLDVSGGLGGDGQRNQTEQGYYVPLAEGVKSVVKIPVIGVGHITEPEYADRIIREGKVDMAAVGRLLLANPDFPRQAAEKLGIKLEY